MSNESTKSAVLAKCEEVAPEVGKTYEMSKGTILKTNDRQVGDRFTEYRVDEYRDGSWVGLAFCDETPADSYVWALAADILGIKPKEERPSDALLWECWKLSCEFEYRKDRVEQHLSRNAFHEWLATLPADPLKADRELVKNIFRVSKFVTVSPEMKLWASIARLSGMEVGNG